MSSRENREDFKRALKLAETFAEIEPEFATYFPTPRLDRIGTNRFNIILELILDLKQQVKQLEDQVRSSQGQTSSTTEDDLVKAFKTLSISPEGIIKKIKPITE